MDEELMRNRYNFSCWRLKKSECHFKGAYCEEINLLATP